MNAGAKNDPADGGPSRRDRIRRADAVTSLAAWAMTLLLVAIVVRVAQLQLSPSERLVEHVQSRTTTRTELPVRGDLLDRRGRLLAATRFAWRVYLDPERVKPEQVDIAIVSLARVMNRPEEEIGSRVMWALEENSRRRALAASAATTRTTDDEPEDPGRWLREVFGLSEDDAGEARETVPGASPSDPAGSDRSGSAGTVEVIGVANAPASEAGDSGAPSAVPKIPGPIRYLPFRHVIDDAVAAALRQEKLAGVYLERVPVRESIGGEPVAPIVGRVGTDANIGLEGKLDARLKGKPGKVTYVRDSAGRPLWIDPGQVQLPVHGEDVRLSIDLEVQRMALEELQRGIEEADAAGGRLVAVDPRTGEVLALCDLVRPIENLSEYPWVDDPKELKRLERESGGNPAARPGSSLPFMAPRPGSARYRTIATDDLRLKHPELAALSRNRCVEDVYEPGSTFKSFVWATITELGLARIEEVIDTDPAGWTTPYGRRIMDVTRRDTMTWAEVLVNSSNIGMSKVVERLTHKQLHDAVRRFGFGKPTGIGLAGEASGIVTDLRKWTIYSQTSYAIGHEIAVTPVQMVRAFSAIARTGALAGTLPDLRLTAVSPSDPAPGVLYRVMPAKVAELTRMTLRGVTENMQTRLAEREKSENDWVYALFGKSGTAEIPLGKPPPGKKRPPGATGYYDDQYNSSFVAGGPIEDPRLVVIVVIDDPGPELVFARPIARHYGAATAGPVTRRFMERALTYLGAPPSKIDDDKKGRVAKVGPGVAGGADATAEADGDR